MISFDSKKGLRLKIEVWRSLFESVPLQCNLLCAKMKKKEKKFGY
jgi:hypothetical protein